MGAREESVIPASKAGNSEGKQNYLIKEDGLCDAGEGLTEWGGGHDYPLQYSCLENPMDRGAWRATDHGVAKSQTRLSV